MNCKPGDLAVFVRSTCGNEGLIVTCLRLATREEIVANCLRNTPVWVTDRPTRWSWGQPLCFAHDENLRPIRDSDGADETLAWAGKPQEVAA